MSKQINKKYKRQNKYENLMEQAEVVAKRSHDSETQVGALLVSKSSGAVLSQGYNGFCRGVDDEELPNKRPEKHLYVTHAEMNLLMNCCRHGISTNNCYVVCTLSPCVNCMRALYQAGISEIIVKKKYKDFDTLLKMKDLQITESRILNTKFIKLTYSPRKSK